MTKEIRQEGRSHLSAEHDKARLIGGERAPQLSDYVQEATEAGFTGEQAEAFLAALFDIMRRFVELGFSSDACAYVVQSILDSSLDESEVRYDSLLNDKGGGQGQP